MNLNELRDQAYKIACDHGFHDKELSNEHFLFLVISELMEAVEADRKGKRANKQKFAIQFGRYPELVEESKRFECAFEKCIKDTVEDELADAVIRLLDLAGLRKIDLLYMPDRLDEMAEACKDETFTESIYNIASIPARSNEVLFREPLSSMLFAIFGLAQHLNIDLLWHIEQKMKYNQSRERLHGKKY